LTVRTSDLLIEVYVPFEGRPVGEVRERGWDVYTGNEPPYEQPVDVLERMQQFVAEVRQQYAGQHVVAVTHGDPLAFLMLWAKGMSVTPAGRLLLYREHYLVKASITTFTYQTTSGDEVPGVDYVIPYQVPEPK
jgi:broad specificity phosphatase PhoE